MKSFLVGICLGLCLLVGSMPAAAADFAVTAGAKPIPKEVATAIGTLMEPTAIQLSQGDKLIYDIWFAKQIALKSIPGSPDAGLKTIPEATLLGVAVVHSTQRDYKNNDVAPGTYTMRFALQPQDGDHLGTALFPFFAALIPAKADTTPDGINAYRPMVKASGKETATGHPVVLSLRPMAKSIEGLPKLNEPQAEHRSIQLKASAKAPDNEESTSLFFELVFEGHGEIQ